MELSIENAGVMLFGMIVSLIINDIYNKIRKIKRESAVKPRTVLTVKSDAAFNLQMVELAAKDEEIKNLKAELNKCKFDYACEVAGKK